MEGPASDLLHSIESSGLYPSVNDAQEGKALYTCDKVILFNPDHTIRGRETFFMFKKNEVGGLPKEMHHNTVNNINFRLWHHGTTVRCMIHHVL